MNPQLSSFLLQVESQLSQSGRTAVPPADRTAIVLAQKVTPEPYSEFGFDWLLKEAMSKAKFTKLEVEAEMGVFVFPDRSVLVLLQSGPVYAVPSATQSNIDKISAWLLGQGVSERQPTHH